MSQGQPIPLPVARGIAGELVDLLAPDCERIAIAGSIRRRKPMVGDIEIVAIPRFEQVTTGLFEDVTHQVDMLHAQLAELIGTGVVGSRSVEVHRRDGSVETQQRMGERYKALVYRDLPVDLFMADRDTWGCIFALRTGPGEWNTKLVTDCQRFFRRVEGARVLHLGRPVPTPEEPDFFAAVGQPWVEPWERSIERVRIGRPS